MKILPNDIIKQVDYAIVVASFIYDDHDGDYTTWCCLLMHDSTPYYQVATVLSAGSDLYPVDQSQRFENINDAVKEYHQWGGDT